MIQEALKKEIKKLLTEEMEHSGAILETLVKDFEKLKAMPKKPGFEYTLGNLYINALAPYTTLVRAHILLKFYNENFDDSEFKKFEEETKQEMIRYRDILGIYIKDGMEAGLEKA